MSKPPTTTIRRRLGVPAAVRGWRDRIPPRVRGAFRERTMLKLVAGVVLGGFVLGYLAITLLFFPGFGRSAVVTVPNLRGLSAAAAERRLERLGLEAERSAPLPNPRIGAGRVLTQDPLPGQEITRGSRIRLILSSGPDRRPVPSIRGLTLEEARAALERMGFQVSVRRVLNDAPEGRILGLRPAAGTQVPMPAAVQITVSAGPPKVLVPSVLTLPEPEARARLQAAGLRLGRISYDPFSTEALGGIASQSPAAGDSLRKGGAVSVVISGTDPTPEPVVEPDTLAVEPEPAEPEPEPAPEPPEQP